MKSIINIITIAILGAILFASCKKSETSTPAVTTVDTGTVHLEFFNVAGGSNLNLNNQWYKNEHGDSFKVTKFNYYISNIKLTGPTSTYTEQEGYHLIEQTSPSTDLSFELAGVPAGKYTTISFMIGVDSLHNVAGAQGGDLDPVKGNFWSWSTGYIMLKFEGISPKVVAADHKLMYHCGGFSGANSVLKTVTLTLPEVIEVTKKNEQHIHLQADVQALFKSPNVIDFSATTIIHMPGEAARKLADNYADMFTVTHAGL